MFVTIKVIFRDWRIERQAKKKTSEAGGQGSLILKLEALEIIFSGRKG
jgi:hypothetical protein